MSAAPRRMLTTLLLFLTSSAVFTLAPSAGLQFGVRHIVPARNPAGTMNQIRS